MKTMETIRSISEKTGLEPWKVDYVVRTRQIEPDEWAGHCRLFSEETSIRIENEIGKFQEKKTA